jgi:hypothetical protein
VPGVRRLRVRWGVDRHPQGADWAKGVYRVPIAVMVSFGEDKMASGSLFVPNAPYFLSVFLGAHEQEGRAYTARYYHQGGRYFCQPCGVPSGQTVVTEFDLATHFGLNPTRAPSGAISTTGPVWMQENNAFSFRIAHHSLMQRQQRVSPGASGSPADERYDRRTLSILRS